MRKYGGLYYIAIFCFVLYSCSGIRRIRPLETGASAVSLSLGGPITEVSKKNMPLPLFSVGYNRGITNKLSIEAGLNFTSALFGLLHCDAGINWFVFNANGIRPGLTVTPKLFFMSNFTDGGTRVYPTLAPVFYWVMGRHLVYTGLENWFELSGVRSDGNDQAHHWLMAPCIGYGLSVEKWQFQIEGRAYTPNLKNTGRVTENIGFGDYGIIGVFLGCSRTFGGGR